MPLQDDTIISLKKVMEMTGISRSSIYGMMKENKFPVSYKIMKRKIGWSRNEIMEWINNKKNSSVPPLFDG